MIASATAPQAEPAIQPSSPFRNKTSWDPAKAREMAEKGRAAKKAKAEAARLAALNPQPVTASQSPPMPQTVAPALDAYLTKRLKTVRAQLDRVDALMAREEDPQKLDRLASAQSRLAEQERLLADRPMPGSKRPAPQGKSAGRASSLLSSESSRVPAEGGHQDQE